MWAVIDYVPFLVLVPIVFYVVLYEPLVWLYNLGHRHGWEKAQRECIADFVSQAAAQGVTVNMIRGPVEMVRPKRHLRSV